MLMLRTARCGRRPKNREGRKGTQFFFLTRRKPCRSFRRDCCLLFWQTEEHFYTVLRYVERIALRTHLVGRVQEWRWSSLWRRQFGDAESHKLLHDWPLPRPRNWVELVNQPQTDLELAALRRSVQRGTPFGSSQWEARTAKRLQGRMPAGRLSGRSRPRIANPVETLHEKRHRADEAGCPNLYSWRSMPISCRSCETDSTLPRRD
jgi:hypothetical protein